MLVPYQTIGKTGIMKWGCPQKSHTGEGKVLCQPEEEKLVFQEEISHSSHNVREIGAETMMDGATF